MEQYFLELMLSQQERGNKQDGAFSKQAWSEILTFFNAKYGPQHRRRVLRHRYKKLLKYYSDLAVMIRQDGFSWDENQQMVTADDDVWDSYIKVHPNARSYRLKTLPNYKNLELIFGDAMSHVTQINMLQDKSFEPKAKATKAGGERSRTYWTRPMDRHLIDLLLDQVHKGNRIGNTLISQAWIDVVSAFNANFNSHYDKDVLKNRYKHLRKQYNDVKSLLEYDGFSWDDGREMVTAEDHAWDAYIKAHPHARSYRVKTVPSYQKLCVIYGQENFEGIHTYLAHKVDPDAEVSVIRIGEEKNNKCPTGVDSVTEWTPLMDRYLIDLMDQVCCRNEINHTFHEQAWAGMVASFEGNFGVKCDKQMLAKQYDSLMKQYKEISNLLNHDGFTWNETEQKIVAQNHFWETYIKEHPNAVLYRDKVIENYNRLCSILGTSGAVDGKLRREDLGMDFDQSFLDIRINEATMACCIEMVVPEIETSNEVERVQTETSVPERPNKMQKTDKEFKHGNFNVTAGLATKFVNKGGTSYTAIESAIDVLQAIPDIDDELLLDGCDLLEDEKKAKTFVALDATLRKKWLLRKLGRS